MNHKKAKERNAVRLQYVTRRGTSHVLFPWSRSVLRARRTNRALYTLSRVRVSVGEHEREGLVRRATKVGGEIGLAQRELVAPSGSSAGLERRVQ